MNINYLKRPSDSPLHTLSKLYDVPVGFVHPSIKAVYCFICGRRKVAVARYRMICLVLVNGNSCYSKMSTGVWKAPLQVSSNIFSTQFIVIQTDSSTKTRFGHWTLMSDPLLKRGSKYEVSSKACAGIGRGLYNTQKCFNQHAMLSTEVDLATNNGTLQVHVV